MPGADPGKRKGGGGGAKSIEREVQVVSWARSAKKLATSGAVRLGKIPFSQPGEVS